MLIRYIKNAPGATAGTVRDVEGRYAIPLIDLGYAVRHMSGVKRERVVSQKIEVTTMADENPVYVDGPSVRDVVLDEDGNEIDVSTLGDADKPKKKRQYKRRDLQAEK